MLAENSRLACAAQRGVEGKSKTIENVTITDSVIPVEAGRRVIPAYSRVLERFAMNPKRKADIRRLLNYPSS